MVQWRPYDKTFISTHTFTYRRGGAGGSSSVSISGGAPGFVTGLLAEDDVLLGGAEDPSHHKEDAAEADELIRCVQICDVWVYVLCGSVVPLN